MRQVQSLGERGCLGVLVLCVRSFFVLCWTANSMGYGAFRILRRGVSLRGSVLTLDVGSLVAFFSIVSARSSIPVPPS